MIVSKKDALKLHSGDEVRIKNGGHVAVVVAVKLSDDKQTVLLDVLRNRTIPATLTHEEVR